MALHSMRTRIRHSPLTEHSNDPKRKKAPKTRRALRLQDSNSIPRPYCESVYRAHTETIIGGRQEEEKDKNKRGVREEGPGRVRRAPSPALGYVRVSSAIVGCFRTNAGRARLFG